ncbi:MAG: sugar phosphate nucleotidyltransferase, partial [Myxococcota bacterium]|nr:sugar phosphate nucleotidyltransferase [Myxococcota bacterium]
MDDRRAAAAISFDSVMWVSCLDGRADYARRVDTHQSVEQAVILAAGRGTRLAPITDETPKALVPFLGHPLLDFAAAHLVTAGVRRIAVNAHHLGGLVADHVRDVLQVRYPTVDWTVSMEADLLGTGGALANLRGWLGSDDLFVVNADAVFAADLRALVRRRDQTGADAVWMVTRDEGYAPLRVVQTDGAGNLKAVASGPVEGGSTFCGVHLTSAGLLEVLPDGPSCVVRQGYLPWLNRGARVATWETTEFWADTGTPERYIDAHRRGLACLDRWRALDL